MGIDSIVFHASGPVVLLLGRNFDMSKLNRFIASCAFILLTAASALAQDAIKFECDAESQVYSVGDEATVTIGVYQGDELVTEGNLSVRFTNDGRATVAETQAFDLAMENPVTVAAKLDFPGFLQIVATAVGVDDSKKVTRTAGLAFDPEKIEVGRPMPEDFDEFWNKGQEEVRALPIDLEKTKIDSLCNDKHDVYAVSFATVNERKVHGFLAIPKQGEAPYPAIVNVPGAGPGVGPETWLADEGFVAFTMNVFPYPVSLDPKERQQAYDDYNKKLGHTYCYQDSNDRDKYFFRAVYLGIDRAIDWLAEEPYVDPERIGFWGSSQGGASALILGGLNKHFCAILSAVPALCDHGGYEKDRSPGWPRLVDVAGGSDEVKYASQYIDAAYFARRINVPITVTVGFIDGVCSPSSVYAAYNSIPSEQKRILHEPLLGHQNKEKFSNAYVELRNFVKNRGK